MRGLWKKKYANFRKFTLGGVSWPRAVRRLTQGQAIIEAFWRGSWPVPKNISPTRLYFSNRSAYAKTEEEWAKRAAMHLKVELKRAEVTYEELAERLKAHGFSETKASITNKLARATLSAHFFLASLAVIGKDNIAIEDI